MVPGNLMVDTDNGMKREYSNLYSEQTIGIFHQEVSVKYQKTQDKIYYPDIRIVMNLICTLVTDHKICSDYTMHVTKIL